MRKNFCRHFVTVLGTGTYEECVYETEDGKFAYTTPYVQMAVLKYVMPEYRVGDKITVFVTEDAEKKNWTPKEEKPICIDKVIKKSKKKNFYKKLKFGKKVYEIRMQIKLPEYSVCREISLEAGTKQGQGLKALMKEEFPQVDIKSVRIPAGRNRQELDEIFECIYQELSKGETVYFDFTHGLRNLPIQALAVVNYAKVLKGIQVGGLYYGAFALEKDRKGEMKHAQIIDMSSYSIIQDWTSAAEAFVKSGSGNQIYKLYQSRKNRIDVDEECKDILESLHDLTNCLETSRGELNLSGEENDRSKKSIACAYESFQKSYERLGTMELPTSEQPLKRLFEYIDNDIKIFGQRIYIEDGGKEMKYTALGMSVVQWAIDKNLIQQGFTALNETIISYVCELYDIAANSSRDRNMVHDTIRSIQRSNWKWATRYPEIVRERWVEKWEKEHDSVAPGMSKKIKRMLIELPEKVFYLSNQVSKERNAMNHFGVLNGKDRVSYEELKNDLQNWYDKMRSILEERHIVVQGRDTAVVKTK